MKKISPPKRVSLNISSRNSTTNPGSGIKYQPKKKPESNCIAIHINNINPIIEVTDENGKTCRFTKKFT
jgi:hypothetical protein